MSTSMSELSKLLALVNRGREAHKQAPLELTYSSTGSGRKYWLVNSEGYTQSLSCTAKEMYKVLDTYDNLLRPWPSTKEN